jgi:hypothetical protein
MSAFPEAYARSFPVISAELFGPYDPVIVVDVPSNDIAVLRQLMPAVLKALPNSKPGTVTHVQG